MQSILCIWQTDPFFYVHIRRIAPYWWEASFFCRLPPISFDSPSLSLSPPPFIQPDGLPLTEHWHQMCSSSADSGTSWAECASGSVNENGSAVCVRVCVRAWVGVCCVSVACDSWGTLCGWGFREWATASCTAAQLSRAVLNSTPTKVETIQLPIQNKLSLSLRCTPLNILLSGRFFFFIRRAVSHNPHLSSYIIIYSFL